MSFTINLGLPEPKSMDTSKAEALPGVRAVLRYNDPELPPVADLSGHYPEYLPGRLYAEQL